MKRRDFLAITAMGTASLPVLARARSWLDIRPAAAAGIDHAIFDARFEDSRLFGRILRGRGHAVSAFHGDVTGLWSGYLDNRWRGSTDIIAGQTDRECFVYLSQLAMGHGVYPKFWIEHTPAPGGGITHGINGPAGAVAVAAGELAGVAGWSSTTARLLGFLDLHKTAGTVRGTAHSGLVAAAGDSTGEREAILVSWIMAPTRQTRLSRRSRPEKKA